MRAGLRRGGALAALASRRDRRPPTFLLGAGAHLTGVTGLHAYLAAAPECEPGPHREYHVLDSAALPSESWVRDLLLERARVSLDGARSATPVSGRALQRAAMIADPEIYHDFFAGLLARPGIRLSMDLTPEHSLLSAEQLRPVRDGFTARGVRVVAAFVMRDPLDRLVTHVRLQQRQRPEAFPGTLAECVERLHTEPTYVSRTRYEHTVAALDETFEPDQVWFGFHERLMTTDSLQRLSETCGIAFREPEVPVRSRPGPTDTAGLPEDLARVVVHHYRSTYELVADRFGLDDLVGLWPSARFAL